MAKTILVPTDYSDTANNALRYALRLANSLSARIILLHVYHIPIPTTEIPVLLVTPRELERENQRRIKALERKIAEWSSSKIKTESIIREGFATDEILDVIKEKKVDMVVMGITGAGNSKNALWGSTTTSVMKKTKCPVLIIPKSTKFKKPKRLVIAYDFNGKMPEKIINPVKSAADSFSAEIIMFDMLLPKEKKYEKALTKTHVENVFGKIKHSMHFREGENINLEIAQFAAEKKADWLVMIPHKYNLWESIFHQSNTKQMAFGAEIPLLAIHD